MIIMSDKNKIMNDKKKKIKHILCKCGHKFKPRVPQPQCCPKCKIYFRHKEDMTITYED